MHDALTAAQAVVDMQRQMDATDNAIELRGLGHHLVYRKRDLSDVLWSMPEGDVRNWRPWARGASREVLAVLQIACADVLRARKSKPAAKHDLREPEIHEHLRFARM